MRIAIEGCSHGELDAIYASIAAGDERDGAVTELVLLCGDFQAVRNAADLHCLAVPEKYRRMGDFHRYYSGALSAPYLTLVVGGNHEASNYLHELHAGGWLAPGIFYLGAAGCVSYKGLRIAGISGIFKAHDYERGRFERMPYGASDLRSVYHTRKFDVERLALLQQHALDCAPDVVLSHDWPLGIEQHGDVAALLKRKPFFRDEVRSNSLGSPPLLELLRALRPRYWFAAHLHVKFAAVYEHGDDAAACAEKGADAHASATQSNGHTDKPEKTNEHAAPTSSQSPRTNFLALGKCVPGQESLQILDIAPRDPGPSSSSASAPPKSAAEAALHLSFVPEWLAVLRATQAQLSLERNQPPLRPPPIAELKDTAERFRAVKLTPPPFMPPPQPAPATAAAAAADDAASEDANANGSAVPPLAPALPDAASLPTLPVLAVQRFVPSALPLPATLGGAPSDGPPPWYTNVQTAALFDFLGVRNNINAPPPPPPGMPPPPPLMLAPLGLAPDAHPPHPLHGVHQQQPHAHAQARPPAGGARGPHAPQPGAAPAEQKPQDPADEIKRIRDAAAARKRKRAEMLAGGAVGAGPAASAAQPSADGEPAS